MSDKSIRLSKSERAMILAKREKEAKEIALQKFQEKAIHVTSRWLKWSNKFGSGLTYSTFQSDYEFNYQDKDRQQMYEAVKNLLSTMRGLNIYGHITEINEGN